jgi:hypothetical protein
MLPGLSLPPSFARLLAEVRPCFTAPTFLTFCGQPQAVVRRDGRVQAGGHPAGRAPLGWPSSGWMR